jgi:hypothetical protein
MFTDSYLVYLMAILQNFVGHLYIFFSTLVYCTEKNLATLKPARLTFSSENIYRNLIDRLILPVNPLQIHDLIRDVAGLDTASSGRALHLGLGPFFGHGCLGTYLVKSG